jgi:hypothetical protein
MKLLKKISIGAINGVRGGLRDVVGRVLVMVVGGITGSYKEKTNETMGTSYAFNGEFRAINRDGEECTGPVLYLPEPIQSLLKGQIDDLVKNGGSNVEFGFRVYAVEDASALKGYYFESESMMEARASTALADLAQRIGLALPSSAGEAVAQIGHDTHASEEPQSGGAAAPAKPSEEPQSGGAAAPAKPSKKK